MRRTEERNDRLGALSPRYAFVLNPHADSRFTRCPRCGGRTNLRKLALVIHVEHVGLVLLGKTCRLCPRCETLIAHKDEVDALLRTVATAADPDYVVLGTIDGRTYRRGLSEPVSLDDIRAHMADFKSYWQIDVTRRGWYPKDEQPG
jgi:hypothetical protein